MNIDLMKLDIELLKDDVKTLKMTSYIVFALSIFNIITVGILLIQKYLF